MRLLLTIGQNENALFATPDKQTDGLNPVYETDGNGTLAGEKLRVAKRTIYEEFREFGVERRLRTAKTSWHWRESCRSHADENATSGATNWIPRCRDGKHPGKRHAPPRCAKR